MRSHLAPVCSFLAMMCVVAASAITTFASAASTVGYLIDVDTLAKDASYHQHPETYTIGQAKTAWLAGHKFTLLLPPEGKPTPMKHEEGNVDLFGWQNHRNPQQQREGHADDTAPYNPPPKMPCHHQAATRTMDVQNHNEEGTAAGNQEQHYRVIDREVVRKFVFARRKVHDNHGYLKVLHTTSTRVETTVRDNSEKREMMIQDLTSAEFTVEGYLTDILCVDRVIALDGPNMITNPQGHSKHCAVYGPCVPSGYTILTPPNSTSQSTYGPMYNLTSDGNTAALKWLNTLDEWQRNLLVKVTGKYTSDGKFEIVGASSNTFGDTTSATSDGEVAASTSGATTHFAHVGLMSVPLLAVLVFSFSV